MLLSRRKYLPVLPAALTRCVWPRLVQEYNPLTSGNFLLHLLDEIKIFLSAILMYWKGFITSPALNHKLDYIEVPYLIKVELPLLIGGGVQTVWVGLLRPSPFIGCSSGGIHFQDL